MNGPGYTKLQFRWGCNHAISVLLNSVWRLLAPLGWEASGKYGEGNHLELTEGVGQLPLSQDGFVRTFVTPAGFFAPDSSESYLHTYHLPVHCLRDHAVLKIDAYRRISMYLRLHGTNIALSLGPAYDHERDCPGHSRDSAYLLHGSIGLYLWPWGVTEAVLKQTLDAYHMLKHLCEELQMSECYGSEDDCMPPNWMWGRVFQFGPARPNRLIIPFEERRMPTPEECADRRLDGTAIWQRTELS